MGPGLETTKLTGDFKDFFVIDFIGDFVVVLYFVLDFKVFLPVESLGCLVLFISLFDVCGVLIMTGWVGLFGICVLLVPSFKASLDG